YYRLILVSFMGASSDVLSRPPLRRGLSWQVDIPAIANLVSRVRADGLKKIAQAGLDIHTIGCMLALGDLTPACSVFRAKLQKNREAQRNESQWIFTLVEYGSGTNFVVDELLQTETGENILALLSAIISILGDASSAEILTLLFNEVQAPTHSTPSV